ncbi:MAG: hypothetical protein OHK003_28680 [Anaerolineales bacterium]
MKSADNKRPLKVFPSTGSPAPAAALAQAGRASAMPTRIPILGTSRDAVRALYTRLTDDGVDAWLDKQKLLPGQNWE